MLRRARHVAETVRLAPGEEEEKEEGAQLSRTSHGDSKSLGGIKGTIIVASNVETRSAHGSSKASSAAAPRPSTPPGGDVESELFARRGSKLLWDRLFQNCVRP